MINLLSDTQPTPWAPRRVRAVTHLDVDHAGIERALEVLPKAA